MTTPSKAAFGFRRVVRANRLIAEGRCPGCEMDYKPKIESLETELRVTRRALEMVCNSTTNLPGHHAVLPFTPNGWLEAARKEIGQ